MTLHFAIDVGNPVKAVGSFFEQCRIRKSVTHESDTFEGIVDNRGGFRSGLFSVGDEVKIYHDIGSPATNNQIFLGRIEYIKFDGEPNSEKIRCGGRDYTSRLMDSKVQAVYTSGTSTICEVGSVVRDLVWLSDASGLIGTDLISGTSKVVQNFRVKNKSVYETVKQLAEFVDYDFYVNFGSQLVFRPLSNVQTGYTLGSMNVTSSDFSKNSQEMYNKITVYGGKQFFNTQDSFTGDGVGSVYTLNYAPHNTRVTVSGALKQGGVFELVNFLPTGTQYLIDFDKKNVIFISGTDVGNNIVGSLVNITVQYEKAIPIIKEAVDDPSIIAYGVKENVITNSEITDPQQALDIAKSELARTKDPLLDGRLKITSSTISGVQPGQTVLVHLPFENISGTTMKVIQTTYNVTKQALRTDSTIDVRVGNRIHDVSDVLRDLIIKKRELDAYDTDSADIITRYRSATGSFGVRQHWFMRTQTFGSSFILGNATYGDLGSGANQANPQTYLGDSRGSAVIIESGGDFGF